MVQICLQTLPVYCLLGLRHGARERRQFLLEIQLLIKLLFVVTLLLSAEV